MSKPQSDSGRAYHTQCTGPALATVQAHAKIAENGITLFGSCFCPFVQRVWAAFEYLGVGYKVSKFSALNAREMLNAFDHADEVDPYKKPAELLEVSPKGLVPGLRLENYSPPRALNESTVILEFLEDLAATTTKKSLLPPITQPYARALIRLQADHINRTLVPSFYRYLQAQDPSAQISTGKEFHDALEGLVSLLERTEKAVLGGGGWAGDGELQALKRGLGLWVEGGEIGLADVMAGPWLYRAQIVLTHYRGFAMPQGAKFEAWLERLFAHPAFKATCSTEELYLDSYERYAFNRPNTSQVANAINSGRGLP